MPRMKNLIHSAILWSLARCFGKRIKELRVARGMSRSDLATRIGLEPATIKAIELGNRTAFRNIELLAVVLHVEPRDLFDFGPAAERSDIENEIIALVRRGLTDRKGFDRQALAVIRALLDK